ncbi:putative ABC-type transport system, periplasmic component/surface lipoprotein [Desulfosporosinus acidiphilus SJ4]|uniref:Putative ABC-type transport system, periplasmic component/surface lipoprotein n=1 Tax=Desulfosporosinus acidiphilus (strain DSM 22704 / JCM 16185 / SJ4) TaxID=646529 RepID=I4D8D0_DESAJ|nr:BMP family ABC transporter substrate-binding protein [Desulfosporosinus acidiphilus]AFM42054.1 putative ABC-type transport system, periplasmic component/surface lipoprotein [Desulfosporosinus acidiphilus SJ4]
MKKSRFLSTLVVVLTLAVALVGCANTSAPKSTNSASAKKDFKVGLVTDVGGLNDHSFNFLANKGLEKAASDLGITKGVVESKQMTDYETNLTRFAQDKYNLVIAVGFLMQDAVEKVSKEYPNTKFMIIDSEVTDRPNVASAMFKTEQCGYLVGVMAGLMEKTPGIPNALGKNTVGVVGGMKIPPVDDYIAGFIQGAKSVNSDIKVNLNYTNKFDDPALGKQTALSQIANGADIVFPVAGGTGTGVIDAAKQKNVYAIGVDADQNYMAPETVMTSALKGMDTATYDIIKDTMDGKFKSGDVYFDLSNNGVGFATPIKAVPKDVVDKVNDVAQQIKDGKIKVSNKMPAGF